jgi:hypothetical protein
MDSQQTKYEISKKVTEIKKLLQVRDFEIIQNLEDDENSIIFHGYSTPDAFKNDLIDDHFGQLDELIYLSYLNELDGNKQVLLVESVIDRLTFYDYYTSTNYDEYAPLITQSQTDLLTSFIDVQKNAHQQILENLTQKYLSEVTLDKTKIARIVWEGNQNQLAELFQRLQDRGWITIGKNKSAFYRTLATVFDTPGSNKLLENLSDYFKKDNIPNGAFKDILSNEIK